MAEVRSLEELKLMVNDRYDRVMSIEFSLENGLLPQILFQFKQLVFLSISDKNLKN